MIELAIDSAGLNATYDITDAISEALVAANAGDGLVPVFAVGSTVGLTVMRHEPGSVQDMLRALNGMAPDDRAYLHGLTTGDPNGFSHIRSSLLGTSLVVPWQDGALKMSDTHRVVLFDFDLRPARRTILLDPTIRSEHTA
jgi:secondary thiamine-phosphate synthase enzyme